MGIRNRSSFKHRDSHFEDGFDSLTLMTSIWRACRATCGEIHQHRFQPPVLRVGHILVQIAIALNEKNNQMKRQIKYSPKNNVATRSLLTRTSITAYLSMTYATVLNFLRSFSTSDVLGWPPQYLPKSQDHMTRKWEISIEEQWNNFNTIAYLSQMQVLRV